MELSTQSPTVQSDKMEIDIQQDNIISLAFNYSKSYGNGFPFFQTVSSFIEKYEYVRFKDLLITSSGDIMVYNEWFELMKWRREKALVGEYRKMKFYHPDYTYMAVYIAIWRKRLDILKWLYENQRKIFDDMKQENNLNVYHYHNSDSVLHLKNFIVQNGNIEIWDWSKQNGILISAERLNFTYLIKGNDIEFAKHILKDTDDIVPCNMLNEAIKEESIEMMKILMPLCDAIDVERCIITAFKQSNIEIFKLVLQNSHEVDRMIQYLKSISDKLYQIAFYNFKGQSTIDCLNYLKQIGVDEYDNNLHIAYISGKKEAVEYYKSICPASHHMVKSDLSKPIFAALLHAGNMELIEEVSKFVNDKDLKNPDNLHCAIISGKLDVFKYVLQMSSGSPVMIDFKDAIANGHLELVRYMYNHVPVIHSRVKEEIESSIGCNDLFMFAIKSHNEEMITEVCSWIPTRPIKLKSYPESLFKFPHIVTEYFSFDYFTFNRIMDFLIKNDDMSYFEKMIQMVVDDKIEEFSVDKAIAFAIQSAVACINYRFVEMLLPNHNGECKLDLYPTTFKMLRMLLKHPFYIVDYRTQKRFVKSNDKEAIIMLKNHSPSHLNIFHWAIQHCDLDVMEICYEWLSVEDEYLIFEFFETPNHKSMPEKFKWLLDKHPTIGKRGTKIFNRLIDFIRCDADPILTMMLVRYILQEEPNLKFMIIKCLIKEIYQAISQENFQELHYELSRFVIGVQYDLKYMQDIEVRREHPIVHPDDTDMAPVSASTRSRGMIKVKIQTAIQTLKRWIVMYSNKKKRADNRVMQLSDLIIRNEEKDQDKNKRPTKRQKIG